VVIWSVGSASSVLAVGLYLIHGDGGAGQGQGAGQELRLGGSLFATRTSEQKIITRRLPKWKLLSTFWNMIAEIEGPLDLFSSKKQVGFSSVLHFW
jgi:hypothetical protein